MKFHLETTEDEILEKGDQFLESIASELEHFNPELADQLIKSIPNKDHRLQHNVLADLQSEATEYYNSHVKAMLADINKILDATEISKAEDEDAEDALEPGDVNVDTGDVVPDPEERAEEKEDEEEPEEKSLKKAKRKPVHEPDYVDHSQAIVQDDLKRYIEIRTELKKYGYINKDFDKKSGRLYGQSVNQLIDLARELKNKE